MRLFPGILLSFVAVLPAMADPGQPPSERMTADAGQPIIHPRALAKNLAERLVTDFVFPQQGARYAAMLNANADAGKYDTLVGAELAQKLGEDLHKVAPDGHLRVMFNGQGGAGGPQIIIKRPPDGAGGPPPGDGQPVMIRMEPPPFMEAPSWIAPGIAYVRFNLFPGGPEATEAARQFMESHAKAKVIIFDLRAHIGGGLDEMDVIFPWLFAKPTRLVTMAARKSVDEAGGSPISDVPSMRIVKGDPEFVTREHWVTPGKDKRLNKAKVYVLTSGFSASAAEHFALAFKHTGRGMLIGQKTYGANHFGGDQDLGGGYTAFIPVGRTYDPVTGKDWEATGIAPDIETAPEDGLIKALTLSGVPLAKAKQLSSEVQRNKKAKFEAPKVTGSVAFSTESGRPVVAAQVNGQEMPVIFDSGSQGAVISKSLADSLKLEVIGEAMVGSPYGGPPKTAFIVSLGSLAVGGVDAVQTDAVIIDDGQLPPGSPALVIGPNLFADRVVELDFTAKTLRFSSGIPSDAANWQKMDGRGMLKTMLTIGQEKVEVTIDTGNPGGVNLPKSLADRLGIALTPMPGRKIKTVDAEFPLYEGKVDQNATLAGTPLRLGSTIFADIPSANAGAKALDGMRLIIDTPRRRWRLEPAES